MLGQLAVLERSPRLVGFEHAVVTDRDRQLNVRIISAVWGASCLRPLDPQHRTCRPTTGSSELGHKENSRTAKKHAEEALRLSP